MNSTIFEVVSKYDTKIIEYNLQLLPIHRHITVMAE